MKIQKTEAMTIQQAKDTILQTARIYFLKDETGAYRMNRHRARPLCLMGAAGIGKTEIVRQAAEEMGISFLSYSITHHTRQSLVGLPIMVQCEISGEQTTVTEYTMSEIIAEIYRMIRKTGKQEGILFLDEFNCVSESIWPVMLQLLQQKTLGPHAIPEGWMLVMAGNPAEYNCSATDLDAVTADRLRVLWVEPDYAVWKKYMEKKGIHPVVLSYLNCHQEHFYLYQRGYIKNGMVTARGWEDLSVMLQQMEKKGFPVTMSLMEQYLHDGTVVRSFYSYYQQYDTLIASGLLEQIFSGDEAAEKLVQEMSFEENWSLVTAVMDELHTMADEIIRMEKMTERLFFMLRQARMKCQLEQGSLKEELLVCRENVKEQQGKQLLMEWSQQMRDSSEDWELLQKLFHDQFIRNLEEQKEKMEKSLHHVIRLFRETRKGSHHLQFLFNELAGDDSIMQAALGCHVPEMKQLFYDVSFCAVDETEQLLKEVRMETRKGKVKNRV